MPTLPMAPSAALYKRKQCSTGGNLPEPAVPLCGQKSQFLFSFLKKHFLFLSCVCCSFPFFSLLLFSSLKLIHCTLITCIVRSKNTDNVWGKSQIKQLYITMQTPLVFTPLFFLCSGETFYLLFENKRMNNFGLMCISWKERFITQNFMKSQKQLPASYLYHVTLSTLFYTVSWSFYVYDI